MTDKNRHGYDENVEDLHVAPNFDDYQPVHIPALDNYPDRDIHGRLGLHYNADNLDEEVQSVQKHDSSKLIIYISQIRITMYMTTHYIIIKILLCLPKKLLLPTFTHYLPSQYTSRNRYHW